MAKDQKMNKLMEAMNKQLSYSPSKTIYLTPEQFALFISSYGSDEKKYFQKNGEATWKNILVKKLSVTRD